MSQPSKWDEFRRLSEEFQRKRIERLRSTEDLPPSWSVFPNIPHGSIGWRMGPGEDYLGDWYLWIPTLTLHQLESYQARYPVPNQWQNIYAICLKNADVAVPVKSWGEYWDAKFEKQKTIIQSQMEIGKQHEKT